VIVSAENPNSTATGDGPVGSSGDDEHVGEESGAEDSGQPGQKRKMRWYVVQAYSGYENKVKASLEERIRQYNMQDDFGEILIPREQVTETRGTAKRVMSRTFYPGYMFVQMNLTDESWHLVKDTPKVSGFVGGRYPTAVPASQINLVAQQVAEGAAKPKPRVVFEQGDHVRVVEGAFANFTGTIEEVKPEKQKVRVLVSIFGRATPVELDYAQVEKTV
jgi:transcriptional antiterminator NusG